MLTKIQLELRGLTEQDRKVLELIATGRTDKEIAIRHNISLSAAKRVVGNIMKHLRAKSRTHAVYIAIMDGILDIERTE
jgi:DNA-binding NarL/FixJ family response regulator